MPLSVFVSLMRLGFSFGFHPNGLDIFYNSNLFFHVTFKGGFIILGLDDSYNNISSTFISYYNSDFESINWHAWLGHIGQHRMSRLAKQGLLDWLTRVKLPRCDPYLTSKATIKPFSKASRASTPLDLIHLDIYRALNVKAHHRAIYFITLMDDYSGHGYVYLLSHDYEALDVSKCLLVKAGTQLRGQVKTIHIHRGHEYLSDIFQEFCEEKGIQR